MTWAMGFILNIGHKVRRRNRVDFREPRRGAAHFCFAPFQMLVLVSVFGISKSSSSYGGFKVRYPFDLAEP